MTITQGEGRREGGSGLTSDTVSCKLRWHHRLVNCRSQVAFGLLLPVLERGLKNVRTCCVLILVKTFVML